VSPAFLCQTAAHCQALFAVAMSVLLIVLGAVLFALSVVLLVLHHLSVTRPLRLARRARNEAVSGLSGDFLESRHSGKLVHIK
jgi:hypothetical protein